MKHFQLNFICFISGQKEKYYENLKLAIEWNQISIAKSEIFTGEECFTSSETNELMLLALELDRPDFVELFIENQINLNSFLTYDTFTELCKKTRRVILKLF